MAAEVLALEPKKCLLILNDMINRLFKGQGPPYSTPPHRQEMLDNVIKLVDHCRAVGTPIVWITTHYRKDMKDGPKQMSDIFQGLQNLLIAGVPDTDFIDELPPAPEEFILVKQRWSAFWATNLDCIIRALGTETLILAGVGTHRTIEGTARDAKNRDIPSVVVSDSCTAAEVEASDMTLKYILPILVHVRTTDEVISYLHD